MDEELGSASVREQLIVAGISELEIHGIADFSLRRVAADCNISCAAPYKHFKGKEALIEAILIISQASWICSLTRLRQFIRIRKPALRKSALPISVFALRTPISGRY